MWLGYISFGFISDRLGRKRSYVGFLVAAAAFMLLYSRTEEPLFLFALGPFVAFFGTGYFTGFGALTAEIYPTSVRATAQGITYNTGRIVSAAGAVHRRFAGPDEGIRILVPHDRRGLPRRRSCFWIGIPETKGRALE